jgi:hypothetical protein
MNTTVKSTSRPASRVYRTLGVRLTEDTYNAIRDEAAARDRSMSWLMNDILTKFIAENVRYVEARRPA